MRGMHVKRHIEILTIARHNHVALWAKSLADPHVLAMFLVALRATTFVPFCRIETLKYKPYRWQSCPRLGLDTNIRIFLKIFRAFWADI